MTKKLLGIDLGGTTIKFGILTLEGEVQEKWAIDTNTLEDGKHIVPDIVESIKHRLNLYGSTKDVWVHQVLLTVKTKLLQVPST